MKKLIPIITVILVAAVLIFLIIDNQKQAMAPDPPGIVTATGTIEIIEIDVSPKISGRILKLTSQLGEKSDSGRLLAELDIEELRAHLDEIQAGYALIESQIKQARIQLENLNKQVQRLKRSLEAGAITQSKYDEVETQRDYTRQQISTFRAQEESLRAQEEVLMAQIENAFIYAPLSGWITSKNMEVGELAMPGIPIYTISDLSEAYINVYVNETRIGEINLGDSAHVTIDTYPDNPFTGFVDFISPEAEFTPKNIQTKEERVKLVFRIRISLDNPENKLKPGLPADVTIYTD